MTEETDDAGDQAEVGDADRTDEADHANKMGWEAAGRGRVIETRVDRLWLEGGILRVTHKPGAELELADAEAAYEATRELVGAWRMVPILVDMRETKSVSREARQFFAGTQMGSAASAMALVIGSSVSRMIGNFFLAVSRSAAPVRLFTREDDALAWLREFLDTR